jgi:hypothetical protein
VLLKTIFDLDPNDPNPALSAIARIWKRQATVPTGSGGEAWTMDHIGISPRPGDYDDGVARPAGPASVPYGFAFENPQSFAPLDPVQRVAIDTRLGARELAQKAFLLAAKLKTVDHEDNWEKDRPGFGTPGSMDRVFFSCAACHVGRVVVNGKMKFLPGMPNTQIEAQYYSKLLMLTGASLVRSGFDVTSRTPVNPNKIEVNRDAVQALYAAMIDKALHRPETLYGDSAEAIARGKLQTLGSRMRSLTSSRIWSRSRSKRTSSITWSRRTTPTRHPFPTCSKTAPDRWTHSASPPVSWRSTHDGLTTATCGSFSGTTRRARSSPAFRRRTGCRRIRPG